MKILITLDSRTVREGLSDLKRMVPSDCEFVVPETGSDEELASLARDVEVILCVRLSQDVLNAAKKLRLIQKVGAGVDAIPFDSLEDRGIYVANTSGANATPVAEGAFALLICLAKRIIPRHNCLQQGIIDSERGIQLKGKTLGILGLGSIGTEVAKMGLAFGMKVVAIRRNPTLETGEALGLDFLGGPADLECVLETSDFIIVTLPLTPGTRGIIGEKELKMMKKTAYIINVARAAIIQEEPLYRALKEKWIAGAGLDVWYTPHWWDPKWQPTGRKAQPSRYPIHKLDNVVATPHRVGSTDARSPRTLEIIAENIVRTRRGEEPINQVDRALRY